MCGIYGERSLEEAPVDRGRVAALTRLLAHRGPDEEGFFFGPGVALGHRRLRVIDLAAGRQPIANEDGTRAIIHDGRVYRGCRLSGWNGSAVGVRPRGNPFCAHGGGMLRLRA